MKPAAPVTRVRVMSQRSPLRRSRDRGRAGQSVRSLGRGSICQEHRPSGPKTFEPVPHRAPAEEANERQRVQQVSTIPVGDRGRNDSQMADDDDPNPRGDIRPARVANAQDGGRIKR